MVGTAKERVVLFIYADHFMNQINDCMEGTGSKTKRGLLYFLIERHKNIIQYTNQWWIYMNIC